jgi:hypothetical protein
MGEEDVPAESLEPGSGQMIQATWCFLGTHVS